MTKKYKWVNDILGWVIGIFASAVYIMTAEPTASWWDCGEYIATANKLLVGHPPGAPTFQLLGRVFSMFAGGDVTKVAVCINSMSAICSGLTIMFLFWTMTMLGRKLVANMEGGMTSGRMVALFGSALVGSLTYTFTDTFWFSAVEGEVYAMSSFFTALVFWCILKWDFEYDNPKGNVNPNRWIVLIAYLIGLSIGVHLLNLLTIPAVVLIVYFKLSKKATVWGVLQTIGLASVVGAVFFPTAAMILIWVFISAPLLVICARKGTFTSIAEWGVLFSLIGSFILLGLILYGIIPTIVNLAGKFEIFFVNSFGMPFNSGTIIYFVIIAALIAWGLWYGYKRGKGNLVAGVYCFLFLLIGYSTFFVLTIRSNANPTIDENNPEDAVALLAYLNREQYGDTPFLTGRTYDSRPSRYDNGTPVYVRDDAAGKYVIADKRENSVPYYDESQRRFMPRMYDHEHKDNYINWIYANDPVKAAKLIKKTRIPDYQENIRFMHSYQFYYMYWRYFMWNFSGRQCDVQGTGGELEGNWITGINSLDQIFLGKQAQLKANENKGHNKYYMLPLLLGIIGILFYSARDGKNSFIVLMLFLMTGLAISFYLNMYAFQPRERDYAFAASFYAFSIWVGFGVFGIYSLFEKLKNSKVQVVAAGLTTCLCLGLVPGLMASQNWDDHDRSHRYTALAAAKAYLDSCAPNAIIFTMGDNDTFPLWYAQEVEGYRTDVRVCNLSLLSAGWYVDQMKRKAYSSEPLPISMEKVQYRDGTRDAVFFLPGNNEYLDLNTVMDLIKQPQFNGQSRLKCGAKLPYYGAYVGQDIPASFSIPVDRAKVLANGTVKDRDSSLIVDRIRWNLKNTIASRSALMVLDILATNNWERPVYFATSMGSEGYFGLEEYFQMEGFAYRLVPIKSGKAGRIDSDILYENVMNKFDDHTRIDRVNHPDAPAQEPYPYAWGGVNDPRVYNSDDNIRTCYYIQNIHSRLAQQLIYENKLDSAEKVLDHCQKVLPNDLICYKLNRNPGYTDRWIEIARMYNSCNPAKATALLNTILGIIKEELDFYETADDRTLQIHHENIELIYGMFLPRMREIAKENLDFSGVKLATTGNYMIANADRTIQNAMANVQSLVTERSMLISRVNSGEETNRDDAMARIQATEDQLNDQLQDAAQSLKGLERSISIFEACGDQNTAERAKAIHRQYAPQLATYFGASSFEQY